MHFSTSSCAATPTAAPAADPPITRAGRFSHHSQLGHTTRDYRAPALSHSRIAEEVIAHLGSLIGADVKVTLEIEAVLPSGAPDNVVRTVTENSRTLKFTSQGFEKE